MAAEWSPAIRPGEFPDYNFDIQPYSSSPGGPEEEYAATLELLERVAIPLGPQMTASGYFLDVGDLLTSLARKRRIPGVERWVKKLQPQATPATESQGQQQSQGGGRVRAATQPEQGPQAA